MRRRLLPKSLRSNPVRIIGPASSSTETSPRPIRVDAVRGKPMSPFATSPQDATPARSAVPGDAR